jgi:uncharacterized protein (TIGR02145 family)
LNKTPKEERMKNIVKLLALALLPFLGCTDFARENPFDPKAENYFENSGSGNDNGKDKFGSLTYEGQTYKTVAIGNQTWMAENLNYYVSGSKCYGDSYANCSTYGRLYDWATAMNLPSSCNSNACSCNASTCSGQVSSKYQGICPPGWHIPSNAELIALEDYAGGFSTAGTKLKASSGWNGYSGIPAGTDEFGFAALPGGSGFGGSFSSVSSRGYWWSSTEVTDASHAWYLAINYISEEARRSTTNSKSSMFSVRCLKD